MDIAGEGFKIFPIVKLTTPTERFEMLVNTLPNVTLFPDTEHVNELTATESTVMERQVTLEALSVNTEGNIKTTVALAATYRYGCIYRLRDVWSGSY